MSEVKIPFREQFRDAMLSGQKICTTRTKHYGDEGDIFSAFGVQFEIITVVPSLALWVGNFLYRQEGFNNPSEFRKLWEKMHPRLREDALVFVHIFKKIDGD